MTCLLVTLLVLTTGSGGDESDSIHLKFGLYQSDKATVMYRMFLPVLEVLETAMSEELGRDTDIELRIFRTYDEGLQSLIDGEVDFARFGPASLILAMRKDPKLQLLAMELYKGKKSSDGVVIVSSSSSAQTLSDLKGGSFAFGDKNSTIGRYLIQAELLRSGITASDFTKLEFLGRHDSVLKAVQIGDFDAGSLKESTYKTSPENLRVIHRFKNVTKPWVARSGLPAQIVNALTTCLVNMKDQSALATLKVSGFSETSIKEYFNVVEAMKEASAFGLN